MATTIVTKYGSDAPAASDLVRGELAVDTENGRLYTENSSGAVVEIGLNPEGNVDVTGTVTADGLTVDGAAIIKSAGVNNTPADLSLWHTDVSIVSGDDLAVISAEGSDSGGSAPYQGAKILFEAAANWDTGSSNYYPTNINFFTQDNSGTDTIAAGPRMVISSAGNVGIGLSSGISSKLHVNTEISIGADGDNRAIVGYTPNRFYIGTRQSGTNYFDTVNVSGGNVGIGTSPDYPLHISSTGVVLGLNATSGAVSQRFNENGTARFFLSTLNGSNGLAFVNGDGVSERMRIDSSGNLLVGKTTTAIETVGINLFGTGRILATADGDDVVVLNRKNSDGDIAVFKKDSSTTVGSIGTLSSKIHVGSGDTSLFFDSLRDALVPHNGSTNAARDAAIDLGRDVVRFKDLHLSGSVLAGSPLLIGISSAAGVDGSASDANSAEVGSGYINLNRDDLAHATQIQFGKNGAVAGRIHTDDRLSIGTGSTGIYFYNTGNSVLPFDNSAATPASRDAAIDLGSSGARFKDLYLSGGVQNITASGVATGTLISAISGVTNGFQISANTSNEMTYDFNTGAGLKMRLTNDGNLLVGLTSISDATSRSYGNAFSGTSSNPNWKSWGSGSHTHAQFRNGTSVVGSITSTSSATAYNTSSDQRLKENIVDAPSASDDIDAIQVRSFDWKADGSHQKYGMVAQELQSVAPEAVSGDADSEEMMGVDYSKLVPMMLKEIQSLRARVAQLES